MEHWFDDLARKMAARGSRRSALKFMGGTIGAALLTAVNPRPAFGQDVDTCVHFCNQLPPGPARGKCKQDCGQTGGGGTLFEECAGDPTRLCVATNGSVSCCRADEVCVGGACQCPVGLSECGGTCVNFATDFTNCGGCGNACHASFQACVSGQCVCPAGQTVCNGVCRSDFTSDPLNCGACGNACPTGTSCCGGSCVNLQSNNAHCGTCGNACPAGQGCVGGVCQTICPTGQTPCGNVCVNLQTDPTNCGVCGNTCPSGNCVGGVCTQCPAGVTECGTNCCAAAESCCGTTCADLQTSSLHCGACNSLCFAIDVGGHICPPPSGSVPRQCCAGVCKDLWDDAGNCGACGNACPTGQNCCNGHCCAGLCVLGCCVTL